MASSRMLTMTEAAEYLGIRKRTFEQKYQLWHVPHYRPGRSVLFREDELEMWLQAQRRVV